MKQAIHKSKRVSKRRTKTSPTGQAVRLEHPADIMTRLLQERISITENGLSRDVTALEAILLQLWLAVLSRKPRAFSVWNQYRKLIPNPTNRIEIDFDSRDEIAAPPSSLKVLPMTQTDKVGYGRPPIEHQFKKGQSGNPKGRPKRKLRNVGDIVADVMHASAAYSESGKKKLATRDEVGLRALLKQAMTGDIAAASEILKLIKSGDIGPADSTLRFHVTGWLPDYPGQTAEQKKSEGRTDEPQAHEDTDVDRLRMHSK